MRNLSTYVACCAFSLFAPLAVGSMLSTGKGEAREIVTRNKAQGCCIPTPCCSWWIILPMCFRSDRALSVWAGLWRMESDMFRAGAANSWLLTSQGSCCSLPTFSLTGWWVGLSHIPQWVKSSKSIHKDSSSAQFLWSTHPFTLPEVELENGHMAARSSHLWGQAGIETPGSTCEYWCSPAPLTGWLLCTALCGTTQRFLL